MTTIPPYLTRNYVTTHPEILFICATDRTQKHEVSERGELAGCKNVFWVPIKVKPCMDESAFFKDHLIEAFEFQLEIAHKDYLANYYHKYQFVVIDPTFGQSNWAGPMKEKTPLCWDKLRAFFHRIETPHVIDWNLRPE